MTPQEKLEYNRRKEVKELKKEIKALKKEAEDQNVFIKHLVDKLLLATSKEEFNMRLTSKLNDLRKASITQNLTEINGKTHTDTI